MGEVAGAGAAARTGIGSLAIFFAWLSLNFFAVAFLPLAALLCLANLPDSLRALSGGGAPDLGLRLFGLPALVGLMSGCFSNCLCFPTFYRARFPTAGFAEAALVILLSGSLFWAGLLALSQLIPSHVVLRPVPDYAISIPFLVGALLLVSNALSTRFFRYSYRSFVRKGGLTDWLGQDFPRFVLGDEAWKRYRSWLWDDASHGSSEQTAMPWVVRFATAVLSAFIRIFLSVAFVAVAVMLCLNFVAILVPWPMPWIDAAGMARIALPLGAVFALANICMAFDALVEIDHRDHFFSALCVVTAVTFALAWAGLSVWYMAVSPSGDWLNWDLAVTLGGVIIGLFFFGRLMMPLGRTVGRV